MTPQTSLSDLENYLRLTTLRQQTIAANMANVDTPGYRTHDIDFEGELHRAMMRESSGSQATDGPQLMPAAYEVPGLLERPDGNNVSLDREGLLLSEAQMQQEVGVQLVKRHFHLLLSAINGGGQ